jgi:hypothetical protein
VLLLKLQQPGDPLAQQGGIAPADLVQGRVEGGLSLLLDLADLLLQDGDLALVVVKLSLLLKAGRQRQR